VKCSNQRKQERGEEMGEGYWGAPKEERKTIETDGKGKWSSSLKGT